MNTYCQSCGSLQRYNIEKPKFCHNCGKALGPEGRALANQEPEEDDSFEYSNLNKLDVEIETEKSQSVKLGDLMATALENENNPGDDYERPKVNRKDVLAALAKEGGTLRPRNEPRKEKQKKRKK